MQKVNKVDEYTTQSITELNTRIEKLPIFVKMKAIHLVTKIQWSLCKKCLKKAISLKSGNINYCRPCREKQNKLGNELEELFKKNGV